MNDQFMDEVFRKVTSDMDPFKRIASKIPGFSGYVERQNRRVSDKLLREICADRFEEQWREVSRLQQGLIQAGQIEYVDDLEQAAIKLRTFADRIRRATYGYSGLFDAVQINEEELAEIYRYDAAMLEMVDEIARAVGNVEASIGSDGLPAAIRHLSKVSQQAIEVYNRRNEAIIGTGEAQ